MLGMSCYTIIVLSTDFAGFYIVQEWNIDLVISLIIDLPTIYVLIRNMKNIRIFNLKIFSFFGGKIFRIFE